ncbi:MAG: DJ-1/PfpI family protein [Flavobacteriaceae bacterium]|jgi:transcriptional regulator GlxA family with amidase domain|nr:DJ-1/PfpI family protein [Flavobacteriaceae bacterium]
MRISLNKAFIFLNIVFIISMQCVAMPLKTENKPSDKLKVGMVVYDDFEMLDVFGPLEMFGLLRDKVDITIIGQHLGSAKANGGPSVVIDKTFEQIEQMDILLVPGGQGSRKEVYNKVFIEKIKQLANKSSYVGTICTGSALLSQTDLLDGKKATTNKRAFKWVESLNLKINWVKEARWVEDGKFFTSSGVSAGTDMALALIAKIYGKEIANNIADIAEYQWNEDSTHDIFAKKFGVIE